MKTNRISHRITTLFSKRTHRQITPWQAAAFLIGITVLSAIGSFSSRREEDDYYENQKLPAWAPPGWVFAPAWTTINTFLVWGAFRLINKPKSFAPRHTLLRQQAVLWILFLTFGPIYFKLRSPILAHLWTQADALISLRSLRLAQQYDRKLAYAYIPLTAWTWFASTVSGYQALYNADPFFNTKAPVGLPEAKQAFIEKQKS